MTEPAVPLSRQIAELTRERRDRDVRFARAVTRREMKQAEADYLNETLDAAIRSLEWLEANRETVLRVHADIIATKREVTS